MAEISVGSAIGAGFELIGKRPLTVLTWGLVRVGLVAVILALYAPTLIGVFAEIAAKSQTGLKPSEADMQQMMSHFALMQGASALLNIVNLLVGSVIICAVARAIVHPERGAFASMRVGGPELYVVVLSFGAGIVFAFGIMICAIPFIIVGVILGTQHMWVALAVVIALAVLVLFLALIYIIARFAFVVPMMVDDGQFHLFDAWALTKGKVGSIVLIGFCLMLIGMALGTLVELVLIGVGVGGLAAAAGGVSNLQAFFTQTPPDQILTKLAPWIGFFVLLLIPVQGAATAIFIAPWAKAYRDVVPALPPVQPTASAPPAQLFGAAP